MDQSGDEGGEERECLISGCLDSYHDEEGKIIYADATMVKFPLEYTPVERVEDFSNGFMLFLTKALTYRGGCFPLNPRRTQLPRRIVEALEKKLGPLKDLEILVGGDVSVKFRKRKKTG
jgi:hypothetical protein